MLRSKEEISRNGYRIKWTPLQIAFKQQVKQSLCKKCKPTEMFNKQEVNSNGNKRQLLQTSQCHLYLKVNRKETFSQENRKNGELIIQFKTVSNDKNPKKTTFSKSLIKSTITALRRHHNIRLNKNGSGNVLLPPSSPLQGKYDNHALTVLNPLTPVSSELSLDNMRLAAQVPPPSTSCSSSSSNKSRDNLVAPNLINHLGFYVRKENNLSASTMELQLTSTFILEIVGEYKQQHVH